MNFQHIILNKSKGLATLWLNRPDVHNAFHEELIFEIIQVLDELKEDSEVQILVLRGKGKSFCAGADLKWMKKAIDYSHEKNLQESLQLSECLFKLYSFPKPTVAVVHGSSFGGANGLLAACDFVLADNDTVFSLSEVKLGLIPACISPYIIKRIGESHSKSIMLRGNRFGSDEALKMGLINFSGDSSQIENEFGQLTNELLSNGPKALAATKDLILHVVNEWTLEEAKIKTAQWIAELRSSSEGQEGMKAFFEKRPPNWIKK